MKPIPAIPPSSQPMPGLFHIRVRYPGFQQMSREEQDLLERHTDVIGDTVERMATIPTNKPLYDYHPMDLDLKVFDATLYGTRLHARIRQAIKRLDPSHRRKPKAYAAPESVNQAEEAQGIFTRLFLTGRLARHFNRLLFRMANLEERLHDVAYVYDNEAPPSKSWIPLDEELLSPRQKRLKNRLIQALGEAHRQYNQTLANLKAATPKAVFEFVVPWLEDLPRLQIIRPQAAPDREAG